MLQLICGYIAGCATVITAVCIMNRKLKQQQHKYDNLLDERDHRLDYLSFQDAFRQGREYEANEQHCFRTKLSSEIAALQADNNNLRHQLGLECTFQHKLKTVGRATMQVR